MNFIGIIVSYIFVSNVILNRFLGLCPFVGCSKEPAAALTMGLTATAVMSAAALLSSFGYYYLLMPLGLQSLRLLFFMLLIVFLVQLVELLLERFLPLLHSSMGIYLPLMSSNCAVLGIILWNIDIDRYNTIQSFAAGLGAGLGFSLALLIMAAIRDRLTATAIPRWLQGTPITFLTAALLTLAFKAIDQALLQRILYGW